jgi:hypothetical protein
LPGAVIDPVLELVLLISTNRHRVRYPQAKKTALFEKSAQKPLFPPAFERPGFGPSKAGGNRSFLLLFFRKEVFSSF